MLNRVKKEEGENVTDNEKKREKGSWAGYKKIKKKIKIKDK